MTAGGHQWDLTSTAGDVHKLTLEAIADKWFAASFPTRHLRDDDRLRHQHARHLPRAPTTALYILGYASEAPNQTLLVYDAPVLSFRFPASLGQSWVVGGARRQRHAQRHALRRPRHLPDLRRRARQGGAAVPRLRQHAARARRPDPTVPGGISVTRIQYLFFHECYGELGRMVSVPNEPIESFANASGVSSAGPLKFCTVLQLVRTFPLPQESRVFATVSALDRLPAEAQGSPHHAGNTAREQNNERCKR